MTSASPAGTLTCHYHERDLCRSCTLLGTPYERQVADKDRTVRRLLAESAPDDVWSPPAPSPDREFRNKAKFAVGGTRERPTLGLTDAAGRGVDLRECGIHDRAIWQVVPDLAGFVTLTGLEPYDVAARRGDLKFVLVTANPVGELLVRFVVRDGRHVEVVRRHVPALVRRLPNVVSVSVNFHPEHRAVVEGDDEVQVFGPAFFPFPLAMRTLLLHHRSFFQTNTAVADQLYAQAGAWADEVGARSVMDLYCGVGGFALHLAAPGRRVRGVEIEADAVAAARAAAGLLPDDCGEVSFTVGDASAVRTAEDDMVIVNPPRRGIGADLCAALDSSTASWVLYSSCNPVSLASDLARMPRFEVVRARLFDMFPQTQHSEVAVLLRGR